MAPPPTSLLLSFDSTLQPLLLSSSSSSSSPARPSPSFLARRLIRVVSRSTPLTSTSISRSTALLASNPPLDNFNFTHKFPHGSLRIRKMHADELEKTVNLLAESFSEVIFGTDNYVTLFTFLVRQYIEERLKLVPHTAVLVGLYNEDNSDELQLVCTAEVSFDALGANAASPTPLPPLDCPYICNMTTKKSLRRKGIGSQLLKACEDLILKMNVKRQVYLHCRVADKGPFALYTKAGYKVVKTQSIVIWLTLQRRKHLMCKELQPAPNDRERDVKPEDVPSPNDRKRDAEPEHVPQQNGSHLKSAISNDGDGDDDDDDRDIF